MAFHSSRYIISQILIWCTVWLFFQLILSSEVGFNARFLHRTSLIVIGVATVVFINLKWLIPRFYFQKKSVRYVLSSIVLLLVVVWGVHSDLLPWNQQEKPVTTKFKEKTIVDYQKRTRGKEFTQNFRWLIRNLPPLFISLLGSSLVSVSRFASEKEKEAIRLEKAKLEADVRFLKSQINPHFLFNTLHNIYASTIIQSDQASEQILKLSDILRYMLYDSNEERVSLEREVEYLKNYLELALLKDSRGLDVRFDSGDNYTGMTVAPLLFIPFVENAFKHSQIEDLKNGYIHISLNTLPNGLVFEVKNSKPRVAYTKDRLGGIGLENIKQRLALLYPDKHHLHIEDTENTFHIHLELNCS